jgi:hypothetical protein
VAGLGIRAVAASDCDAVLPLLQRAGMARGFTPDSWRVRWRRLFEDSPALRLDRVPPATGFVAEHAGRIAGYFGSIPLLYRFRGRRLVGGMATGWVVDPAARGRGAWLAQRYFRQPHVDLLVNATANEASAALSEHFHCLRMHSEWVGSTLRWPVAPAALLGKVAPPFRLLAPALRIALTVAAVRPPRPAPDPGREVRESGLDEVGADFDTLFESVAAADPRLLADRSAACLRWRFGAPWLDVAILCLRRRQRLCGFAVVEHRVSDRRGLRRARLLDLLVHPGDAGGADALLWGALAHAERRGADLLEASLLPSSASARRIARGRRLRFVGGARDVFVLAKDRELHGFLAAHAAGAWHLTEFDRDSSI